jgi:hypothetical protein
MTAQMKIICAVSFCSPGLDLKAGANVSLTSETARRGREHLSFCEQGEAKDLVIRDQVQSWSKCFRELFLKLVHLHSILTR